MIKSAASPQVGVEFRIGDEVAVRALTRFATDFDTGTIFIAPAAFYRVHSSESLTTRFGAGMTIRNFDDITFVSVLLGVEYALSEQFAIVGEAALDSAFEGAFGPLRTFNNTGIGIRVGI